MRPEAMSDSRRAARGVEPAGGGVVYLLGAIVVLAVALLVFVADPMKYAIVAGLETGRSASEVVTAQILGLGIARWLLIAVLVFLVIVLLALEARRAELSRAVATAKGWKLVCLAGALLLWFSHSCLYPGHLLAGDSGAHLATADHLGRALAEGRILAWTNYYFLGTPHYQFYAPVFLWLGSIASALLSDGVAGMKLVLFLARIAAGLLMFLFLRRIGLRRVAALLGAMVYVGSFAYTNLFFYRGVFPHAIIIALIPALFLLVERCLASARDYGWDWAALALATAALIATYQPHGLFAGVYLAAFVVVRAWMTKAAWPRAAAIAVAGIAGCALAQFAVVPYVVEGINIMFGAGLSSVVNMPDASYFASLLTWRLSHVGAGGQSETYIGLAAILIGLAGAVLPILKGRARGLDHWVALVVVALIVSFFFRTRVVRDVIYTLFFVSILAALGAERLLALWPGLRRLPLALLLVVFLDLGPTAVQPLARTDKGHLEAGGAYLARIAGSERVVLMNTRPTNARQGRIEADTGAAAGPLHHYRVPFVVGPTSGTATIVHNHVVTALVRLERELEERRAITPATTALLAQLNVSRIVNDTGRSFGFPADYPGTADEPPLGRILRVPHATPAVFAPSLELLAAPATLDKPLFWREEFDEAAPRTRDAARFLDEIAARMAYQPERLAAARIPVRRLPDGWAPRQADLADGLPAIAVERHEVSDERVHLGIRARSAGYAQLAHAWYPLLRVTRNGVPVETVPSALNLIVMPVEAGMNEIQIVPFLSPLRIATIAASAAIGLGVLLVPIVGGRRRPAATSAP